MTFIRNCTPLHVSSLLSCLSRHIVDSLSNILYSKCVKLLSHFCYEILEVDINLIKTYIKFQIILINIYKVLPLLMSGKSWVTKT